MPYHLVIFYNRAAHTFMLETYLLVFVVAHWTDARLDFLLRARFVEQGIGGQRPFTE